MTIKEYIAAVSTAFLHGNATEHSYRGFLQQLLAELLPKHHITNEPSRIACGAPDSIITSRKSGLPLAAIEAKGIGDPDLDGHRQNKEQFTRYKEAIEHLVFTDYLDFHFYQRGVFIDSVRIAELKGNRIVGINENYDRFLELVHAHIALAQPQGIRDSHTLAIHMAGKAKLLAETIRKALEEGAQELEGQYQGFRDVLMRDLSQEDFADLYAQTITYGLFAARIHDTTAQDFIREQAAKLIP